MDLLIFGNNQKFKKLADLGLRKCTNCHNMATFELKELSKKATLYFVPIVKYSGKAYMVCDVCNAAWEVKEENRKKIIETTTQLPDNTTQGIIWNKIDALFIAFVKSNDGDLSKLAVGPLSPLQQFSGYAQQQIAQEKIHTLNEVGYVLGIYIQNIMES